MVLVNLFVLLSSVNGQGVGALRLLRNTYYSTDQAYTSGIVEIYYNGTWGNICDDALFSYNEANVICHQLAFTGVSSYGNAGSTTLYGNDTNPVLLEDVDCYTSSYLVLLQCSYNYRYSFYCNDDSLDAFVVCYTTKIWNSNPYSGQLRVVGGNYSNHGRLEVYCNGQWGTVCDDSFGATDATVACRQLGYSGYSRYDYTLIYNGSNSQPIWLDYVQCTSSFTSCLAYCESCPSYEYHDCVHNEDVSLECEFSLPRTSGPYARLDTCRYANPPSTSTTISTTATTSTSTIISTTVIPTSTPTSFNEGASSNNLGAIIGGVMACIVVICVLIIAIPLCICCYLGVGIGANCRERIYTLRSTVVTALPTTNTTTDVTTDTNMDYSAGNAPSPFSESPAIPYPIGGYPQQTYPATRYSQETPLPYPLQPPGRYPPQQFAGYPPEGYPPRQYAGFQIPSNFEGYPPQQQAGYLCEGYLPQQPAPYPPEAYPYPPQQY